MLGFLVNGCLVMRWGDALCTQWWKGMPCHSPSHGYSVQWWALPRPLHWRALSELVQSNGGPLVHATPFNGGPIVHATPLTPPPPCRANERHAQQLLHPSGLSVPELKSKRVRVVVFRDEKGVKQPIFDSQQVTNNEEEVGPSLAFSSACDSIPILPIHILCSISILPIHILHSIPVFPTQEPCTRSLCDMRSGDNLEGSLSTSSNGAGVAGSGTHSAGWATQSGKSRRGFLVKRPVRGWGW